MTAGAAPAGAVELDTLHAMLSDLHDRYAAARPFPHVVVDDFLPRDVVEQAMAEFPPPDDPRWNSYVHANERKFSDTDAASWGPTLQAILRDLNSPRFCRSLEALTGFDGLVPDVELAGGGLHQSVAGGFLNVHADFTAHPRHPKWRRRVNLLLYLNECWDPGWGGALELWTPDMTRCEAKITPQANRAVIFTTAPDSFHGHPDPMTCPPGVARRSLALYYFTVEDAAVVRSTHYRARPGEGWRRVVISLDNVALRAYGALRRRRAFSDRSVGRVLRRLDLVRRNRRAGARKPTTR